MKRHIRCTDLRPALTYPLSAQLTLARSRFLDSANSNLRSKRIEWRYRYVEYERKVHYVRLALDLDRTFEVIEVTGFERWWDVRVSVALRLRFEPLIGVHVPLAEGDPLLVRLRASLGGAA